jgi:hypothetical protein
VDVDAALKKGSYIPLDAGEMVSTLMINDPPGPVRCTKAVGDLIMRATQGAKGEHPRGCNLRRMRTDTVGIR